ncbi:hypothetical protein FBEOM_4260 [Fusarium beomiforme]|uniref:Uncharacterized protein n=1 Tax=Fusarium beomiforme TaxID=44412 RepID=A0A9P5E159_9HYPO|nr:hypothetical protein FBEOM_4260 [Fusarium beomiforme]
MANIIHIELWVAFASLTGIFVYCLLWRELPGASATETSNPGIRKSRIYHNKQNGQSAKNKKSQEDPDEVSIPSYKEIYYKVQNLQAFPDILPLARKTLISMLSEAVRESGLLTSGARSILTINYYDAASLASFLADQHQATLDLFQQYTQRRASGMPRELFSDRQYAIEWLTQAAPLKYADGAWLCGIHQASTPFHLRDVTRLAWQVLSEELGDGDLSKHHVHLYRELLKSLDIHLPDGDSLEFVDNTKGDHGMNNPRVWKAAVSQLLISLFPHEFLPEILGFNLHFELLTLETLIAARELPELGIDGYYFTLHISIDNADSGHTAMALEAVSKYMLLAQEKEKDEDVQDIWRRVQAGYLLSQTLSGSSHTETQRTVADSLKQDLSLNIVEARVFDMIRLKALVSNKIHAGCRARIGNMSLAEWLEHPLKAWDEKGWPRYFLNALSKATPWVRPGESQRSLLIRELGWKGRMFGAFTQRETEDLSAWIDGLPPRHQHLWTYESVHAKMRDDSSQLPLRNRHVAIHIPWIPSQQRDTEERLPEKTGTPGYIPPFVPRQPLDKTMEIEITRLLPLWFAHTTLLENAISTPYRTATNLACHILRILRLNNGFSPMVEGVAGMDEHRRLTYCPSLIDVGLAIVRRSALPKPATLYDTLSWPKLAAESGSAYEVIYKSKASSSDVGFHVGMTRAFLDMETWVAQNPRLLDDKDRRALASLTERKALCLDACLTELAKDNARYARFVTGYHWARDEIDKQFYTEFRLG